MEVKPSSHLTHTIHSHNNQSEQRAPADSFFPSFCRVADFYWCALVYMASRIVVNISQVRGGGWKKGEETRRRSAPACLPACPSVRPCACFVWPLVAREGRFRAVGTSRPKITQTQQHTQQHTTTTNKNSHKTPRPGVPPVLPPRRPRAGRPRAGPRALDALPRWFGGHPRDGAAQRPPGPEAHLPGRYGFFLFCFNLFVGFS